MGRPKGSKNHKRKYTKRKLREPAPILLNTGDPVRELQIIIRHQIMAAPVAVRRAAIADIIADLQWMAQVEEENGPAP